MAGFLRAMDGARSEEQHDQGEDDKPGTHHVRTMIRILTFVKPLPQYVNFMASRPAIFKQRQSPFFGVQRAIMGRRRSMWTITQLITSGYPTAWSPCSAWFPALFSRSCTVRFRITLPRGIRCRLSGVCIIGRWIIWLHASLNFILKINRVNS